MRALQQRVEVFHGDWQITVPHSGEKKADTYSCVIIRKGIQLNSEMLLLIPPLQTFKNLFLLGPKEYMSSDSLRGITGRSSPGHQPTVSSTDQAEDPQSVLWCLSSLSLKIRSVNLGSALKYISPHCAASSPPAAHFRVWNPGPFSPRISKVRRNAPLPAQL